jgi:hypothetical protein
LKTGLSATYWEEECVIMEETTNGTVDLFQDMFDLLGGSSETFAYYILSDPGIRTDIFLNERSPITDEHPTVEYILEFAAAVARYNERS